jgi:hypothetical protein
MMGCASIEGRNGELVDKLNKGLGHYKESQIIAIGNPTQCTSEQPGGGEICEWQTGENRLLYRYDARGVARGWTYVDRRGSRLDSDPVQSQDRPAKDSLWEDVKDAFRGMNIGPGFGSSSGGR